MILVTGATGTVGSALVAALAARGARVRAFVRNPQKVPRLPGVEAAQGDLLDRRAVAQAMKGCDRAFLASSAGPEQVEAQSSVVEAAREARLKLVVKLSALGADAQSPVNVLRWHGRTEDQLRRADVPHAILQPHFFMQNTLGWAASIRERGAFAGAMREGRIALVDARDVALAAAAVLIGRGHEGKTYALTGPAALSLQEIAEILSRAAGRTVKYEDVSAAELKEVLSGAGVPDWLAEDIVALHAFFGANAGAATTRSVRELTGSAPRTYETFAREFAASFAEHRR
jgi:uncharacterized protein YbjT (DUF2867 family)